MDMFLKNRLYIIIFSLIIFSPIFITIGDNYHLYTNRVYHLLVIILMNIKLLILEIQI